MFLRTVNLFNILTSRRRIFYFSTKEIVYSFLYNVNITEVNRLNMYSLLAHWKDSSRIQIYVSELFEFLQADGLDLQNSLSVKDCERIKHYLKSLLDSISYDGEINWGRIIVILIFMHFFVNKISRNDCIKRYFVNFLINFIHDNYATYIIENGGWIHLINILN